MVKFYSLILSCLTFLILATPAYGGRLLFWRFEPNQNRLIFTTDQGIQPTAQLIANPTRLVIDLPGTTLGRPTVNENLGGIITNLRIGQFDARTTRVVVELSPGYVLDPQGIKIKGISPTQWSVELPQPQRSNFPTPSNPNNVENQSNNNINRNPVSTNNNRNNSSSSGLQVTSSGIIVGIDGGNSNKIVVNRSRDRRKIDFEIEGITIPDNLPKFWNVNKYGIGDVEIDQKKSVALLTLNVNPDSPDWQASFSRMGGLVLWPQGGISRVVDLPSGSSNSSNNQSLQPNTLRNNNTRYLPNNSTANTGKTSIESIELLNNQLLIRGNRIIKGQGSWSQGNTVYQIRLENTDLSSSFRNPSLPSGSPISRMRIWQPDNKTVILLIEPAVGARIGQLNQPTERMLALSFNRLSSSNNSPNNFNTSVPISQAPPDPFNQTPGNNPSSWQPLPPVNNRPSSNNNRSVTRGKTLVVIDPGHGGKDVGAVGIGGIQEKNIVLSISQQVASILEQQGLQVRMTRDSDYFISLEGRTQMANSLNADVFVSIHANSAGASKPGVSGYETYYYQNGRGLAETIHRNIIRRVDVRDRKIKQARFYVLRTSRMPSVLLETGFVTGSEDAAKLSNSYFQRQMAEAIAAGIVEYIKTNRL
ncbi:N-acetylmuramoyl-L-alanine amidase [Geminocystis sp. NIES-3709]|uniref:N-acetylmuramoyl-L-alanine amidase n=1 Tax=Geminocystis sp. NIES-3709 TaxID=1617448 RepID=UPI0005FCBC24|nr:N-acetylmuramoyl-L-alanine amidase [Geminocystis sp. NIES-3709]BAQ65755.1 N-acetylmuramoyl-L-alanine amidase [Geminocystis sp. NIES-3709]